MSQSAIATWSASARSNEVTQRYKKLLRIEHCRDLVDTAEELSSKPEAISTSPCGGQHTLATRPGDDPFDAFAGLLSMIEVVAGHRPESPIGFPDHVVQWERWIFGQNAGEERV